MEEYIENRLHVMRGNKVKWRIRVRDYKQATAEVEALEGIEDCLELIAEFMYERLSYLETDYLNRGKNGERLTESIAELEGRDNPELSTEAETYIAVKKLEREFDTINEKLYSIAQMVGLLMERILILPPSAMTRKSRTVPPQ